MVGGRKQPVVTSVRVSDARSDTWTLEHSDTRTVRQTVDSASHDPVCYGTISLYTHTLTTDSFSMRERKL